MRDNNIGLIRLVLASLVVASHSYPACLGPDATDPLSLLTGGQESGGSLAVNLFFLLSGYLISASWQNSSSAASFFRKRILRIYPGFLVAVAFSAVVAAACSYSPVAYVRSLVGRNDAALRTALFLNDPNATLDHAAAFATNPYPGAVNHSLWTLQPELFCYLLVAGFGVLGGFAHRRNTLLICLAAYFGYAVNVLQYGTAESTFWRFLACFTCGAMFREHFRANLALLGVAVLTLAVSLVHRPYFLLAEPLAGGYVLFSLAFARWAPLSDLLSRFDLSYGVYVYAWPVQQLIVYWFGIQSPLVLFATCMPPILGLAWLSWVFVERPFLNKPNTSRSERPGR